MIACGWCGQPTKPGHCSSCERDPALPWLQRAQAPPPVDPHDRERRLLAEAIRAIKNDGERPTAETLAERLDVSPRTVRRWQQMSE